MIRITDNTGRGSEVSEILRFALGRLGVDDITVVVVNNDRLLDRLAGGGDVTYDALVTETALERQYLLTLRERLTVGLTAVLCHESVHISQYVSGRLRLDSKTGVCTWMGRTYPADYEYRRRPWESEAFRLQSKLAREYRKR